MIKIQFKPDHLDLIEDLNEADHEATKEGLLEIYNGICDRSVMFTFIEDGRIVCISGIKYLFGGTGEAFNIRTQYIKPMHSRFIRRQFDYQLNFYDRIQTHSRPDSWEKWHRVLGFEKEAVLKRYCGKHDKVLWVRFS